MPRYSSSSAFGLTACSVSKHDSSSYRRSRSRISGARSPPPECLAIRIDRKLNSTDVIDALSDLFILRGVPGHVRSDNGPEFIAQAVRDWIAAVGAKTAFIEPGSPWENGYCESFNSNFAMNCSTARSFTAWPKQRSSSRLGGATTTQSGHAHRSVISHQRQRPLSGLHQSVNRPHHPARQWRKNRSCIKTENGPLHRGRPLRLVRLSPVLPPIRILIDDCA